MGVPGIAFGPRLAQPPVVPRNEGQGYGQRAQVGHEGTALAQVQDEQHAAGPRELSEAQERAGQGR